MNPQFAWDRHGRPPVASVKGNSIALSTPFAEILDAIVIGFVRKRGVAQIRNLHVEVRISRKPSFLAHRHNEFLKGCWIRDKQRILGNQRVDKLGAHAVQPITLKPLGSSRLT